MRLVTFGDNGGQKLGAVRDDQLVVLDQIAPDMLALIAMGDAGLEQVARAVETAQNVRPLDQVRLLAPLPRLTKNIVCLGMNYAEHARESLRSKGLPEKLPEHPVFFSKPPTTINHPDSDVVLDSNVTQQLDWEVELAFVIGVGGKNIKRADAMRHVWGYTIVNDVSARDLQNRHQQFFKGKSLDGSCPMGPWIVTAEEISNPAELGLRLRLNGQTMQDGTVADLIFDIPTIIEVLSLGQTLEVGDLISTGTPSGVGMGLNPPRYLKPGDVMEAEIDRIGVLRNRVVAG